MPRKPKPAAPLTRRGRPPGSKNQPKLESYLAVTPSKGPVRARSKGRDLRCYNCGESAYAPDGHAHSTLIEYAGKAFSAEMCCACKGHDTTGR